MKTSGTLHIAVTVTAMTGLAGMSALAADSPQMEIDQALVAWTKAQNSIDNEPLAYSYGLTDLDGDGAPEAVVLLSGDYCGSGGCTLLVLHRKEGRQLEIVSKSTIAREPICAATERSHGWRSLIVRVAGGGLAAFDAVLRFDGTRYPLNPSTQPHASKSNLHSCDVVAMRTATS